MSIAKKYAQQYMQNGEVSLEQVIQSAIDEATEIRKQEVALILTGARAHIRQLEQERVPEGWIKCSDRLPAPYQHVVGLWRYAKGVTEMEVTMYEYDGVWFESKEPEYWFPFPAAPAQENSNG